MFSCAKCEFKTPKKFLLRRHTKEKHPVVVTQAPLVVSQASVVMPQVPCGSSQLTGSKAEVRSHQGSVHAVVFACDSCLYMTGDLNTCRLHRKEMHVKAKLSCSRCAFRTKSKQDLLEHEQAQHQLKASFPCPFENCFRAFASCNDLDTHVLVHIQGVGSIQYPCFECSHVAASVTDLKLHMGTDHSKNLYCDRCKFVTEDNAALIAHKSKYHPNIILPCNICYRVFNSVEARQKHVEINHQKVSFPCDKCSYKATSAEILWKHKASQHKPIHMASQHKPVHKASQHKPEQRKHPCHKCDFSAHRIEELTRHKELFHPEMAYFHHCHECGFKGKTLADLKAHITLKHNSKQYPVNEPLPKYKATSACKQQEYQCTKCEFVTTHPSSLRRHTDAVHAVIRHKCNLCDNSYKDRHLLKSHIEGRQNIVCIPTYLPIYILYVDMEFCQGFN